MWTMRNEPMNAECQSVVRNRDIVDIFVGECLQQRMIRQYCCLKNENEKSNRGDFISTVKASSTTPASSCPK